MKLESDRRKAPQSKPGTKGQLQNRLSRRQLTRRVLPGDGPIREAWSRSDRDDGITMRARLRAEECKARTGSKINGHFDNE